MRPNALPPVSRLESTALALQDRSDWPNLVRFVERWAELGEPTPPARLAEALAFVELRLMDRASIRLMELTDDEELGLSALVLAARMYLLRGWTTKARRSLEQALDRDPDHDEAKALWDEASEPPTLPEEGDADPARQLALAEHHVATGAFVKAQSLLERLRREGRHTERAQDLLWALAGDWSCDEPLDELVRRWGAEVQQLEDYPDEAEDTQSIDPEDAAVDAADPHGNTAFPSLFRALEPTADKWDDGGEHEVTQSLSMARDDDLQGLMGSANPEAPTSLESHDDTQIMMVIRRDGGERRQPVDGPIHKDAGEAPEAFDLAAFQRKMGVPPAHTDFDPGLEEEDDDLIILTGKERTEADRPEPPRSLPLEPDPTTSDVDPHLAEKIRAQAAEARSEPAPAVPERPRPARKRAVPVDNSPWWVLALVGVVLAAMVMLLGVGLLKLLLS